MKISPIQQNQYRTPIITPRNTGYTATGAMGVAIVSGFSKNKFVRNLHKPSSYIAAIATALHIGILESYNYKRRRM